ncbi:MAG: glutamine synthetase family protein [Meiothermus sp.]|uniref:glutamine synthetase family protein n=1 Tax=Meiothermus sp. TaxID=1955249 RepID=UPI0028CCF18A|nr:glutamine synthetase family protein [Meiothermus sp.]MDT7920496.1 glutamine synthetase family protein [Meiothermus sp.]
MAENAAGNLSWLAQKVNTGEIDTVLVGFPDHYGRLMGKRFEAEYFLEEVAQHGTHGCDYLLTTDMEMEPVQGYRFANWELGYGDFHLVPDLATLRPASWLEKSAIVLCDLEDERSHSLIEVAPRTMLKRQLERARALGYTVMAASELEYYLYRVSYRQAQQQGYAGLEPAGYYLEDYHLLQGTREEPFTRAVRQHLKASGIPVENSKGEWGLGQHEVNVRYTEALEMADRHVLFKQCLKEVAETMGLSVTFMAKPHHGQAGSSCHIHLSLWKDGQNAFAGEEEYGPVRGSEVFGQFLAGWIAHIPDFMPFYAPTVNSYKRYEDGSWAPTRLAWSYDNRTAGFRVVGRGASLRIECRIGGADLNPYLALTAALASGLDGLEQGLTPPAIFQGDIYQARHLPRVPYTLGEAAEGFASSAFAKSTLGEAAHEHYTHFFRSEWQAYNRAVTDWERKRYFERI